MIYTKFRNTVVQEPTIDKLLPIEPAEPHVTMAPEYIFEPSPEAVLKEVLYGSPRFRCCRPCNESIASEFSARMVAMRNATEAPRLIDTLTLTYNKARQEGITNELMDIMAAALPRKRPKVRECWAWRGSKCPVSL